MGVVGFVASINNCSKWLDEETMVLDMDYDRKFHASWTNLLEILHLENRELCHMDIRPSRQIMLFTVWAWGDTTICMTNVFGVQTDYLGRLHHIARHTPFPDENNVLQKNKNTK
jgi:hypothetical protein